MAGPLLATIPRYPEGWPTQPMPAAVIALQQHILLSHLLMGDEFEDIGALTEGEIEEHEPVPVACGGSQRRPHRDFTVLHMIGESSWFN